MRILKAEMTSIKQNQIKQIPTKPGVYFFKDLDNEIIYIGKAKNLRNRVRSYFQKSKHQSAKNISLIKRIATGINNRLGDIAYIYNILRCNGTVRPYGRQ